MSQCCIQGCESSQYEGITNFTYFNFPIHDKVLLKKWQRQIGTPNCEPTRQKICSMHFADGDVVRPLDGSRLFLKSTSVPTIFPGRPQHDANAKISRWMEKTDAKESVVKEAIVNSGETCDKPSKQSSPFVLVPSKYVLRYETEIPILVPAQFLQQTNGQSPTEDCEFLMKNIHKPRQSGEVLFQFSHENPEKTSQISRENPQNVIEKAKSPRIDSPKMKNKTENSRTQVPAPRISHVITSVKDPIKIVTYNMGNSHDRNPLRLSEISPRDAPRLTDGRSTERTNFRNPTENFESSYGEIPAPSDEILQLNSQKISGISRKIDRSSTKAPEKIEKNSTILTKVPKTSEDHVENSLPETMEIAMASPRGAEESAKTCVKSESRSAIGKHEFQPVPARSIIANNAGGTDPSNDALFRVNKRPALRITINKQYNVLSETRRNSSLCEKENTERMENRNEEGITIENSRANKSVTFKLDRKTGEIVAETRAIVRASTKHRRRPKTHFTRIKQKSRPSAVRKASSGRPKRSKKIRRITKKENNSATVSRTRITRSSKYTGSPVRSP